MISSDLLAAIRRDFALSLGGVHGEAHWARVCENGLHLAQRTGADVQIVELFAYLHDSRRQSDGWDQEHGHRAAEFAKTLDGSVLKLPARKLECLIYACTHHSDGLIEADVTVQTCWDADRLDLGRIGVVPDPCRLCTPAAQDPDVIEWALRRSQRQVRDTEQRTHRAARSTASAG
jgi:uncharacterized protein